MKAMGTRNVVVAAAISWGFAFMACSAQDLPPHLRLVCTFDQGMHACKGAVNPFAAAGNVEIVKEGERSVAKFQGHDPTPQGERRPWEKSAMIFDGANIPAEAGTVAFKVRWAGKRHWSDGQRTWLAVLAPYVGHGGKELGEEGTGLALLKDKDNSLVLGVYQFYDDRLSHYFTSRKSGLDVAEPDAVPIRIPCALEVKKGSGTFSAQQPSARSGKRSQTPFLLPPAGFVLHRPSELLEYSAMDGPHRVDYVETKDACYLDSRRRWVNTNVLATDGAAACFRDDREEGVVWVVPAVSAKTIAVRPGHFGLAGDGFRVTAWDFEKELKGVAYKKLGDKIAIEPEKDVAAYRIVADAKGRPASIEEPPVPPPVGLVLSPRRWRSVPKGKDIEAKVVVFVRQGVDGPVDVTVTDGQGKRAQKSLAEGTVRTMDVRLSHLTLDGQPIAITASAGGKRVTRRCRLAAAEAGSVVKDLMDRQVGYIWGYCRRGGEEQRPAARSGPGPVRFTRCKAKCGGVERPAFAAPPVFDAPPHGYVFGEFLVRLPKEPTAVTFGIGINETSHSPDGVTFSVALIDEKGNRHELFKEHVGNGPWRDERVALGAFAGQWVRLRFQTDCGPKDDAGADSARWAEPRIEYTIPRRDISVEEATRDG